MRAESEPWTQPDEGAAARPVAGFFAQTCAAGRRARRASPVRWTRDPTAVGEALTVHWALTPTARGVGDDPGGRLSADALP